MLIASICMFVLAGVLIVGGYANVFKTAINICSDEYDVNKGFGHIRKGFVITLSMIVSGIISGIVAIIFLLVHFFE